MIGILIISHGQRNGEPKEIMEEICGMINKNTTYDKILDYAFINSKTEHFDEIFNRYMQEGVKKVIIVPYFLFSGHHVTGTIPKIVNVYKNMYADMDIMIADSFGADYRLSDIVMERITDKMK